MSKVFNIVVKGGSDTPTATINLEGNLLQSQSPSKTAELTQDIVDSLEAAVVPFVLKINDIDYTVLFKNKVTVEEMNMSVIFMSGKVEQQGIEASFAMSANLTQMALLIA